MGARTRGAVLAKAPGNAAKQKFPCGKASPLTFSSSTCSVSLPKTPASSLCPNQFRAPGPHRPCSGAPLSSASLAREDPLLAPSPCPLSPTSLGQLPAKWPLSNCLVNITATLGWLQASAAAQANIHKAPTWCRRRRPGRTPEEQRLPCSSRATQVHLEEKSDADQAAQEPPLGGTRARDILKSWGAWRRGLVEARKRSRAVRPPGNTPRRNWKQRDSCLQKITGRRGTGCRSDICGRRGAGGLDGIGLESQRGLRWSQQADRSAEEDDLERPPPPASGHRC